MLTFDPEKHRYFLDGEPLPSVSQVKESLTDFSMVDPQVLRAAADFGTAVHKMVELYLAETLDFSALDENLYGPLEALERWLAEVKPFTAGPAIIDVKSRKYDRVADPVQLAAYHQLYLENELEGVTIERPMASITHRYAGTPDIIIPAEDGGPILNHRILYLGRDGKYQYTPCYDANAWPMFGRLLGDYHRQQVTNQLIHSWRNR
ncbi:MAG TPA: hypothetical protein DCS05_00430 [Nitrospiraceae bacterium]|nr:hypothetical protein [Nitrospiraceae bacterium]